MRLQAPVGIYQKDGHIIRRIVQHHQIRRSVAIHISSMKVITNPKIFQDAWTGLRPHRLEGSVAVTQRGGNQFRAERILLQNHSHIEQAIAIEVNHLEFVRSGSADDRSSKREVSVAWKYTHAVW
jgi:hypothetical protein